MARFAILSLSGGGYLGLYGVCILAKLEEITKEPIARRFDLLAGTSIGGIVALGLAAEIPAAKIQKSFEDSGVQIFSNRGPARGWLFQLDDVAKFLFKPKYDGLALRETIESLFGKNAKMGDLLHRVVVPTVNLTKGSPQIFKTPHHAEFSTDLRRNVADVAMAASAAPTYFPLAEIEDSLFLDGALYANSPDLLAVHEAEHFFDTAVTDIQLLSIGTTTSRFSFAHVTGRQLGLFGWAKDQRLLNVIIASQQHSVNFMMEHRLKDRYLRLDREQSKAQERELGLDIANVDAQSTIRGLAQATVQENINHVRLEQFLKHSPAEPVFFHRL